MSNANVGTNSVESTANPQLEQHVERPREEREREEQREREEANRLMQLLFSPTEVPLPFDDFIMGSLDSNHNSAAEFWQDVDQARARMQEREREREARSIAEANRWCTCASGEVSSCYFFLFLQSKLLERQFLSTVRRQKYSTAVAMFKIKLSECGTKWILTPKNLKLPHSICFPVHTMIIMLE